MDFGSYLTFKPLSFHKRIRDEFMTYMISNPTTPPFPQEINHDEMNGLNVCDVYDQVKFPVYDLILIVNI